MQTDLISASKTVTPHWLCAGREIFPSMLAAIAVAQKTIQLETYIYSDDKIGRKFREALVAAAGRGVAVQLMVDAIGSWLLPENFFAPLTAVGADVRRFNPIHPLRFGVRDHRKLLICDDRVVFIGGFNISDEYDGDGITCGWCDLGLRMENPLLAAKLANSFAELFALSHFQKRPWLQFRALKLRRNGKNPATGELLLAQPGRGASAFQSALYRDLKTARSVRITCPYFLPTHRLGRDLLRVARRGGRVQLILGAKTDVFVSQLAARSLYPRLLKAGVEIYEYQPQILHAKLICIDRFVYVGSSNLDIRSLNLNYEFMLRMEGKTFFAEAETILERMLEQCRKIELRPWRKSQNLWQRWKNHWAHFLLTRIDPFIALQQFHILKRNRAMKPKG